MTLNSPNQLPPDHQNDPSHKTPARSRKGVWIVIVLIVVIAAGWWYKKHHDAATNADGSTAGESSHLRRKRPSAEESGPGNGAAASGNPGPGSAAQGKGRRGGPPMNTVMPVGVDTIAQGDINLYLNGLGTVIPLATATVRARVSGPLVKIAFKEGQIVKQGDLLAEIDPRPYQALVTQAQGNLARDKAQLKAAQTDLQRYKTLVQQDSIARQQVDTQEALVGQYAGTVQADQGNYDAAKLNLDFTRIIAPISGRVGLRQVDVGNIVSSSDTTGIAIITQMQPITAIFSVPEDNIPRLMSQLAAGNKLPVDAWDRQQTTKLASGAVLTIDNQVATATGTIKVKASFPNTDNALFPNQFVNIRLFLQTNKNVVVAPSAALQLNTNGSYMYIVNADNTVSIRQVTAGVTDGTKVEILKGLKAGDKVVVDGLDRLREGGKVVPVERKATASQSGETATTDAASDPATAAGHARRKGNHSGTGADGTIAHTAASDSTETPPPGSTTNRAGQSKTGAPAP